MQGNLQEAAASMQAEVDSLRATIEQQRATHQRELSAAHSERGRALRDLESARQEARSPNAITAKHPKSLQENPMKLSKLTVNPG